MKIKINKKIIESWEMYINGFNRPRDSKENLIIGNLWWTIPDDILWLYATQNDEGYDGSQTQFGVRKDGTIVWAYFSHCSCYGYEDYKGEVNELSDKNEIHTQKTYELKEVDSGVLAIMKQRLTEISKFGLKPLILDTISGDKNENSK